MTKEREKERKRERKKERKTERKKERGSWRERKRKRETCLSSLEWKTIYPVGRESRQWNFQDWNGRAYPMSNEKKNEKGRTFVFEQGRKWAKRRRRRWERGKTTGHLVQVFCVP